MARLLLLRHAKSSWDEPGLPDKERPLSPRGQRAAVQMADAMAERGYLPERILCSPARRTRETLAALLPLLGDEARITITADLYEGVADYRDTIAAHGGTAPALLVIGHNPAILATALSLIGSGEKPLRADIARKFPTGALAVIDFDLDAWSALEPGSGRLTALITPRSLPQDND